MKNIKNIYYLHGFRSSHLNSTRLQSFNNGKYNLINVEYSPHEYLKTMEIFHNIFKNVNPEECLIVGCSFGGYWADYISAHYGIKAILVNPTTNPTSTIKPGVYTEYESNLAFEIKHPLAHPKVNFEYNPNIIVILNKDDEVLNYEIALNHYEALNQPVLVYETGGHRCSNFTEIITMVL